MMNALVNAPRRLITVDEFHRMGEAQIFTQDDRVELIEGELIQMAPIGIAHAGKINRIASLLWRAVGDRAIVSVQNPIALPPRSAPQPDIALLKPRPDFYEAKRASAEDALLVIEVSDTTLSYDRDAKMRIYAAGGIPEAWIVDVNARSITVFLEPGDAGYRSAITPTSGASIALSQLPGAFVRVDELF